MYNLGLKNLILILLQWQKLFDTLDNFKKLGLTLRKYCYFLVAMKFNLTWKLDFQKGEEMLQT